ncbi:hypothetical protein OROMI_025894 [Orobanche minor]
MDDSSEINGDLGDANVIELTGKIMVVAIIILFVSLVFIFCLHLYAKWYWYRRQENPTAASATTTILRRYDYQESTLVSASSCHGLNPIVLKTLPVVVFDPNEFKDGLECAVCLCEVSKGEKTRLLPKCNHGFHLDCIDMWFQSHPTCPLCRNPVSDQKELINSGDPLILQNIIQTPMVENPIFPTNVLFWGDESQVRTFSHCLDEEYRNSAISEPSSSSSSSSPPSLSMVSIDDSHRLNGFLIIDSSSSSSSSSSPSLSMVSIDDRLNGVLIIDSSSSSSSSSSSASSSSSSSSISSSSSSLMVCIDDRLNEVLIIDIPHQINEEEEQKSTIPSRVRSLKKHLSGNRRNNPCSPISLDLEQGYIGQS